MNTPKIIKVPGKVLLFGEYAVLDGAEAIVAAVDRFATGRFEPGDTLEFETIHPGSKSMTLTPFAQALCREITPKSGKYTVDLSDFFAPTEKGVEKLGLGSSAAGAVAFARLFSENLNDSQVFEISQRAHRFVQGSGSGADIAACSFGGLSCYTWNESLQQGQRKAISDSANLLPQLLMVQTNVPASTPKLVSAVKAFQAAQPQKCGAIFQALADAAQKGKKAFQIGDFDLLKSAVFENVDALKALTRDSGLKVFSEVLEKIEETLIPLNVACKSTGAGMGDLAWALVQNEQEAELVRDALCRRGFRTISLRIVF